MMKSGDVRKRIQKAIRFITAFTAPSHSPSSSLETVQMCSEKKGTRETCHKVCSRKKKTRALLKTRESNPTTTTSTLLKDTALR